MALCWSQHFKIGCFPFWTILNIITVTKTFLLISSSTLLLCTVGKIFAFRPQGPQFDPWLCRDWTDLCDFLSRLSQLSFPSFRGRLMSTNICWELTGDGLVSRPGGVKDSHLFNTAGTGDKRRLHGPHGS